MGGVKNRQEGISINPTRCFSISFKAHKTTLKKILDRTINEALNYILVFFLFDSYRYYNACQLDMLYSLSNKKINFELFLEVLKKIF